MQIQPQWLSELPTVPDRQPWRTDEWQRSFYRIAERIPSDAPLRRSAYWTSRLAEEVARSYERFSSLPGLVDIGVGFIDAEDGSGPIKSFGVTLMIGASLAETHRTIDNAMRLEEGVAFPVVARTFAFTPDEAITAPLGGQVACWVRSRRARSANEGRPAIEGWLTAAHVVPAGQQILFASGARGVVVDRAGTCVDAAVVSTNLPPPVANRTGQPVVAPVGGQPCAFVDQKNNVKAGHVGKVMGTLGMMTSQHFPRRFSTDVMGTAGDSGALVVSGSDVLGVYLGRYTAQVGLHAGNSGGVGLAADQLEQIMDMEFLT